MSKKTSRETELAIIHDYLELKMEYIEICEKRQITTTLFYNILKRNNIEKRWNDNTKVPKEIEEKIIIDYNNNVPLKEITKKYGISKECIHRILKRNNIEINRAENKKLSVQKKLLAIEEYNKNELTTELICKNLDIGKTSLTRILKEFYVPDRNNSNNRISEEIELKIINDYVFTSLTVHQIAEKYDVAVSSLYNIFNRHNVEKQGYNPNFDRSYLIPCNENYFEAIDNHNKAYWLGFIAGDGHVGKTQKGSYCRVTIHLALKDINHLEKFKKDSESDQTIFTGQEICKLNGKMGYWCRITINRKKMCEDLVALGVGNDKSTNMVFPNIPEKFMPDYFRGLIDSDGCWCVTKSHGYKIMKLGFVSPVYSHIDDFRKYLYKYCGTNNNIKIRKQPGCYSISYGGDEQLYRVYKFVYSTPGTFLDRKYERCKKFFNDYEIKMGIDK